MRTLCLRLIAVFAPVFVCTYGWLFWPSQLSGSWFWMQAAAADVHPAHEQAQPNSYYGTWLRLKCGIERDIPAFLPSGTNQPWIIDPFLLNEFDDKIRSGYYAILDNPQFDGDYGWTCDGYSKTKWLMEISSWQPVGTDGPTRRWTAMYYLAGDNDREAHLSVAFREIERAFSNNGSLPDTANVVVFIDRRGVDSEPNVFVIRKQGAAQVARADVFTGMFIGADLNTGDPQTLEKFINWTKRTFPSDHTALILADHGNGVSGFGVDRNAVSITLPDWLTPKEVRQALQSNVDVLYFAACLMGTIEMAWQVRDVARYMVANQSMIWLPYQAPGEPYNVPPEHANYQWFLGYEVAYLNQDLQPMEFARSMAELYQSKMRAQGTRPESPYTVSVFDLSKVRDVVQKTSDLALALKNYPGLGSLLNSLGLAMLVQRFDSNGDMTINVEDEYMDLKAFAIYMRDMSYSSMVIGPAVRLIDALDSFVLFNYHSQGYITFEHLGQRHSWNLSDASGLSIMFNSKYKRSFYKESWLDFGAGTGSWDPETRRQAQTGAASAADPYPIEWAPMLIEYFRQTNPQAPDDPNPPQPVAPLGVRESTLFLPMITRTR